MADFGLIEMRFPLPKRLDTALKTDSAYLLTGLFCCLNHEITNTVIGDQVHHDFLAYHVGCFATQNIHAHRRFYIPKEQLNIPALEIKIGQIIGCIGLCIQQCGDDIEALGSESGLTNAYFYLPQKKGFWQRFPIGFGITRRLASDRLFPFSSGLTNHHCQAPRLLRLW